MDRLVPFPAYAFGSGHRPRTAQLVCTWIEEPGQLLQQTALCHTSTLSRSSCASAMRPPPTASQHACFSPESARPERQ
eukprot:350551-Chlamydomonas_euryale.AAC.7